ncbi:MAG: serine/threonine protein kinase, partial [Bacteroidia bacterium]
MIHFSLPIGKKLCSEQYEIVKVLGRGGFGITYLTQKKEPNSISNAAQFFVIKECFLSGLCVRNNDDSVKVVAIEETEFLNYKTRFIQEAALLMKMKAAPHIISVLHFFEENNTAYLVMPYETEETLEKYCQAKPNQQIPENEALDYAFQLISALKALHENNITHQDIKPSNILRKADGNLVLIDFGTAKEWVLTSRSRTLTANAVISPGYAPPESYNPNALKGTFSDVYGLAATLYRLLTGTIPLDATTRSIEELPAISSFVKISHQIEKAIHKALALKPSQRFQTVFDFEKALNGTSSWVDAGENTETINYQTLKKQADTLFQQEDYAAALLTYEKLITHFPKEQEARQKILLLNTLLEKAKQKANVQKIAMLSLLFIVGIVTIGTIFHYWLGRETKETENVSLSSDTLNHVSQADITPPALPNIAQDTNATLKRLDSTKRDSGLVKELLYKKSLFLGDSAMKMKNYQAAQQHWLEALAIHPKNKYIKQQISVCEQEIQKEL